MPTIITLTANPAIDTSAAIDRVVPEQKLRCSTPVHEPGGGGINVARAVHKLGGRVQACYFAGGHTGSFLNTLLTAEEIEQIPIPVDGHTRENFTVYEQSSGLQYRFVTPGPAIQPQEWGTLLTFLDNLESPPAYLVLSGSIPTPLPGELFAGLARWANRHQIRLIVDTSGAALAEALRQGVYLIKPNIRELGLLLGRTIADDAELERAAIDLVAAGQAQVVVVSLGAGGAVVASAEGYRRYRAPTVAIQSKVGAGDSMVAGLVLGLAQGLSVHEAARLGVAAGAAAVMTPGSELCRREDTMRLLHDVISK